MRPFPARLSLGFALLASTFAQSPTLLAQSVDGGSEWLRSEPTATCLSVPALTQRVRRYLRDDPPPGILIDLRTDPVATFVVRRGAQVLGKRSFAQLPRGCSARLDAVALAMALSLESLGLARLSGQQTRVEDETSAQAPDEWVISDAGGNEFKNTADSQARTEASEQDTESPREEADEQQQRAEESAQAEPVQLENDDEDEELSTGRPLDLGLAVGGGILLDVQPDVAPELHLGADLTFSPVTLNAMVHWSPTLRHGWGAVDNAAVATEVFGARISACVGEHAHSLRAEVCAGGFAAILFAAGRGFDVNLADSAGLIAATLGLRVRFPADSDLGLRLRVDAQANLLRPELRIAATDPSTIASGILGAGAFLEAHWQIP